MVSKLNQTIGKVYEKSASGIKQVLDTPINIKPLKTKNISIIKNQTPTFYKAFLGIKEFYKNHTADLKYLLLALPIMATFLIVSEVQRYQSLRSKALSPQASVYFQPAESSLPPEGIFDVWVNAGSNVGFADIEITFDSSLVNLTSEITTYQSLARNIRITSMAEANSSGKISLILGLDPSQINSPPSGTFRIATFKLNAITPNSVSTTINFDGTSTLLASMDQSVFITALTGLELTLNPTPTPSPTGPPIITPAPTPTGVPDTTPPVITINNPQDGYTLPAKGTVKINTSASDESGIYSIKIFIDNVLKKTCSNVLSCIYNWNVKNVSPGTHIIRIEAVDNSPNRNVSSGSITVNK